MLNNLDLISKAFCHLSCLFRKSFKRLRIEHLIEVLKKWESVVAGETFYVDIIKFGPKSSISLILKNHNLITENSRLKITKNMNAHSISDVMPKLIGLIINLNF